MGLLNWITTGGKAADKAVDAVINSGDMIVFTDEEKSIANQKKLDWFLEYLKTTLAQNVARRLIAFMVAGLWVFIILLAIISGAFDRSEGSYAIWLFKVLKDLIDTPFSIVLAFYFAAHVVRAWNEGK